MTNVIPFPAAIFKDGLYWHGGRGFRTEQALIDAMSDKDWRRIQHWQNRHWEWLQWNEGKGRGRSEGSAA